MKTIKEYTIVKKNYDENHSPKFIIETTMEGDNNKKVVERTIVRGNHEENIRIFPKKK